MRGSRQLQGIQGVLATAGSALLWLGGCASPGVPRPPSLHLPAPVRDLSATRQGNQVLLRFTAPDETTDHQPLQHKGVPVPLVAEVCRVQAAACTSVARLSAAPGQVMETVDSLPPALTMGPGRPVLYRVRVQNPAGRDAGESRPATAVAGAAPPPVTGLTATTVAQGVQLTWRPVPNEQAPVRVEAVGEVSQGAKPALGAQAAKPGDGGAAGPKLRLLQVPATGGDPGGAIDAAPRAGAQVDYRVYRERTVVVNGQKLPLRSQVAEIHTVRSADVFPPVAPTGLLAVAFNPGGAGTAVSLSWEPNTEPDVVSYRVYRAVGAGGFARVSTADVPGVSYQDSTASGLPQGSHVRYEVTAVDHSGNESPRSAETAIDLP